MAIVETKELEFDCVTRNGEAKVTEMDRAVDDVGLQVEAENFVAILGYDGSDKSTLAKTLNGILLPSGGTVLISDMNTVDDVELLDVRCGIDMVFQSPDDQIIANLIEDGMGFGPEDLGMPTEEIWQKVDAALKAVGIAASQLKSPDHPSGGQKQRVVIAGVMAMHPRYVVLGKPTAMLDPNGRKEVTRTVTELSRSEGVTVVLITHYMEEVIGADRLAMMDDGKVIMNGTPQEVLTRVGELGRLHLDVPRATELAYELKQRGVSLPNSVLTMEELAEAMLPLRKEN